MASAHPPLTTGYAPLTIHSRLLLGPGPSMTDPAVLRALATPIVGQFDPQMTTVMNEVMALARHAFQTENRWAFPVSGTGRAGLEAALCSLLEPGDRAERCGAVVTRVEAEWGELLDPERIEDAIRRTRPKVVTIVHGETSTGVLQPLEEIGAIARAHDALLVVDAVATLGGACVATDRWQVDVCISGTQKCLSCPSGLAPLTYNARAEAALWRRQRPVQSFYFDLRLLQDYWDRDRRYNHHTAPAAMLFALREALRVVQEEGLEAREQRHRLHSQALRRGVEALGLAIFGPKDETSQMPMLVPLLIPDGVEDLAVRRALLLQYGIEIGAAFGPLQGRVWRVGLMGYSAQQENVLRLLAALEAVLRQLGHPVPSGAGVDAAATVYRDAGLGELDVTDNLGSRGIGSL
ncbi:MAG: alanine--glyoxylate aminotransferase family protein [Deltaproteobacteria bacterium]|nr:alanine--glyoxylate aminotransferase family protein [Deltaproteobacteria bacterium]